MQPLVVCSSCKKVRVKYDEILKAPVCEDCFNETINPNFDFIVIDFEIANNNMSSACSLGMVFVKDNQVIDEKYFLIQPPTLKFDDETVKIHGLTADDVRYEKKFNEVWEEIKFHFNNTIVIAHNAQFDMSVLHSCLTEYSLDLPEFKYIDSISLSTPACQGVGNSLKKRLEHFNIKIDNHHNALSDSKACAELVLACLKVYKSESLQTYIDMSGETARNFSELKPQTYFRMKKSFQKTSVNEIAVTVDTINTNHPFFQKNVVFTGELISLDRQEAMQKVVNSGGFVKSGVSGKTNFLVVGKQDKKLVGKSGLSTKEKKTYELKEKGKEIQILNENEFLRLLEF